VTLLRELTRSGERAELVEQSRHALAELCDAVAAVARDDSGPAGPREKAAEFLIHLRARGRQAKDLAQVIDRVAEAAAGTRYRSVAVLDFLAVWLFIACEEFIAKVPDARARLDHEVEHPAIWKRFRAQLLEMLEAMAERLRGGRRVRLAEAYLARFRLLRARNEERARAADSVSDGAVDPSGRAAPDYVIAMVVDLFALSLGELQQALVVAQIPPPQACATAGITPQEHHRLWQPLRAVRTVQGFERWTRLCQELGLTPRAAVAQLSSGLATHLQRVWEWFFPGRSPYGLVRSTLAQLEGAALDEGAAEPAEDLVARLFRRYAETLSFVVKLATEDSESAALTLDREDPTEGVIGP
jgi:hypothetical protein